MKENTLYVERFRPTELKHYVGNENVKETIQKYLDQGDIQNFIFYRTLIIFLIVIKDVFYLSSFINTNILVFTSKKTYSFSLINYKNLTFKNLRCR
jgi:hypothetical protein